MLVRMLWKTKMGGGWHPTRKSKTTSTPCRNGCWCRGTWDLQGEASCVSCPFRRRSSAALLCTRSAMSCRSGESAGVAAKWAAVGDAIRDVLDADAEDEEVEPELRVVCGLGCSCDGRRGAVWPDRNLRPDNGLRALESCYYSYYRWPSRRRCSAVGGRRRQSRRWDACVFGSLSLLLLQRRQWEFIDRTLAVRVPLANPRAQNEETHEGTMISRSERANGYLRVLFADVAVVRGVCRRARDALLLTLRSESCAQLSFCTNWITLICNALSSNPGIIAPRIIVHSNWNYSSFPRLESSPSFSTLANQIGLRKHLLEASSGPSVFSFRILNGAGIMQ